MGKPKKEENIKPKEERNSLFVLSGVPCCGKTTFCKQNTTPYTKRVSIDDIRKNILKEGDPYYSKEDLVWSIFLSKIKYWLNQGYNVYADARNLTIKKRRHLILSLNLPKNEYNIYAICFKTPFLDCLKRNEERKDGAKLSNYVMVKMKEDYQKPTMSEKIFDGIYEV